MRPAEIRLWFTANSWMAACRTNRFYELRDKVAGNYLNLSGRLHWS
jgi:hypothetical protein